MAAKAAIPGGYEANILRHPEYETVPGYWQRHEAAILGHGTSREAPHERAVMLMLRGWLAYADAHRVQFESGIGEDYVLGPEWERIGAGLLDLLNGPCGRLDCGTVDGLIRDALMAENFGDKS
jgi:hypothetical protein